MIRAFEHNETAPEAFDSLAAEVAKFQARRVPGYGRLCGARGLHVDAIARAADAPAVPADAFRFAPVFAFDEQDASHVFRTSGTTIGARGVHAVRDIGTYDAGALAFGRSMLARDLVRRRGAAILVVAPSDVEAPDSSLSHMCALFARAFVSPAAVEREASSDFFVRAGRLEVEALRSRIEALPKDTPAIVLATSFALVHLLDAMAPAERLALPPGSRVMQTGGFKGRSREVSAHELRAGVARLFGVDDGSVVGEYGMTELSSQFWEATLVDGNARHGVYREPPWARVVPVDPETLAPVADGAIGIARIEDLANVDSAFAVLTQDRVRRVDDGFELLGRAPGATPRGCSIALDEMLSSHDTGWSAPRP